MNKNIVFLIVFETCFLSFYGKPQAEQKLGPTIQLDSALLYQRRATELHILGRNDEAEREYRQTIRLNPLYANTHYNLGVLLFELKRYDEAEKEWREVIRLTPKDVDAHYNLGILLQELKRHNEAEKELSEVIKLDPKDIFARIGLGTLLIELKRYEEAEKEFRETIRQNSTYSNCYNNLGYVLTVLKRHPEAEKEFREAIEVNFDDSLAHHNLGILLKEQKRYNDAATEFKNALKIYPRFRQSRIALAEVWVDSAETVHDKELYDVALHEMNEGISDMLRFQDVSTSEQAAIYNLRGFVLTRLNRFKNAIEDFERALKFDQGYSKAMRNLNHVIVILPQKEPFNRLGTISRVFSITFFVAAFCIFVFFIAKLFLNHFFLKGLNSIRFGTLFIILFALGIFTAYLPRIITPQIAPSEIEVERDIISAPIVSSASIRIQK